MLQHVYIAVYCLLAVAACSLQHVVLELHLLLLSKLHGATSLLHSYIS